jgi:hypothetical protein
LVTHWQLGSKMPVIRRIQQAIVAWVKATAPTLPLSRHQRREVIGRDDDRGIDDDP